MDSQQPFAIAAATWLEQHSRYIKPRTLKGYGEFAKALNRIFGDVKCKAIHIGHLRYYQDERPVCLPAWG
jgi:hypothetical protein